jgi:acetyl-CoA acetyltransferase
MSTVAIAGVGMTAFGKFLNRGLRSLSEEAVVAALADANADPVDVDSVYFANAAAGVVTGQEMIRAEAALRNTGLAGKPMFNIENACASGSSALHLAWLAVRSGRSECVLVVGAERLSHEDKKVSFDAFARGVDLEEPRAASTGSGSLFMDIYAAKTRKWMVNAGVTKEDFARVVVKSRLAGSLNPMAQFREPTTVEAVLASRMVADPLTLFMCSGIGDGAAAVLVCSAAKARQLGVRPVWIRASTVCTALPDITAPLCAVRSVEAAYEQAGIGPEEIHVAELHDASAPAELIHYENLRLCPPGGSAQLIRSGATGLGGRISVNPSGGLLSRGHPVGATGTAQIVELVQQLRGQSGERQRPGAQVAMAENNGGQIGHDAALAVTTILSV